MFLHRRANILKKRGANSEGYPEFHELSIVIGVQINTNQVNWKNNKNMFLCLTHTSSRA
jgi:hypothetical protein